MQVYDLIVVGGGASGMIAAGRAAERGLSVLVLEKNKRLGEKLRISGGGRCNITNREYDERILLKKYGKSEQFLYSLFIQFGVRETFVFFESRGLPLITEAHNRTFPASHKAEDVVQLLTDYMKQYKVTVVYSSPVTKVVAQDGKIMSVLSKEKEYVGKEYLFATGSVSHPETGSTGDGLKWLTALGHAIEEPTPTVVPLAIKEEWVHQLAGVSLEMMKITFFVDEKKAFVLKGKMLFTHFGISGPLILNNAHKVADLLPAGTVTAHVDMFPDVDMGALEKQLLAIFDKHKNKELKNIMKEIVPDGMHKGITLLVSDVLDVTTKVHSITKEERKAIARLFKALPITVEGLMGFDRAVVADGGVPLEEIDMRTMRSKKIHNLLVTGDILHINRPSGGFSLQLCWSTGYVAGSNAGKSTR
jgi:predicted Rossmann fold flavoprotein